MNKKIGLCVLAFSLALADFGFAGNPGEGMPPELPKPRQSAGSSGSVPPTSKTTTTTRTSSSGSESTTSTSNVGPQPSTSQQSAASSRAEGLVQGLSSDKKRKAPDSVDDQQPEQGGEKPAKKRNIVPSPVTDGLTQLHIYCQDENVTPEVVMQLINEKKASLQQTTLSPEEQEKALLQFINAQSIITKNTPLHFAAIANNAQVCFALIALGADWYLVNSDGLTPGEILTMNNPQNTIDLHAIDPQVTGPQVAGPQVVGPQVVGPQVVGPQAVDLQKIEKTQSLLVNLVSWPTVQLNNFFAAHPHIAKMFDISVEMILAVGTYTFAKEEYRAPLTAAVGAAVLLKESFLR